MLGVYHSRLLRQKLFTFTLKEHTLDTIVFWVTRQILGSRPVDGGAMFARLALLSTLALPLIAQQTTATVLGTVSDPSGAAVPEVKVQASNLATNVNRETLSDGTGAYSLPNLPPGTYRITATKSGFQAARLDNVVLQVE
jgi:Carboxypeptidase regulatory-like domain